MGLSSAEGEARGGLKRSVLSRLENGLRANPNMLTLHTPLTDWLSSCVLRIAS